MKYFVLLFLLFIFYACNKPTEVIPSTINYQNLGDIRAGYDHPYILDIDNDGEGEYRFTTVLIADHTNGQIHFRMTAAKSNQILESNGYVLKMDDGETIGTKNHFNKFVESMVIKTTTADNIVSWSGDWKDAHGKFIGVRFSLKNKQHYYGWVRISFDQENEEFILHDFAYRQEVNKEILSGAMPEGNS